MASARRAAGLVARTLLALAVVGAAGVTLVAAQSSSATGVAFCDKCGDGAFTEAHGDYYFQHEVYSFTCTVFRANGQQISFSGTGSSDDNGYFAVPLSTAEANAEQAAGADAEEGDQTLCSVTTQTVVDSCAVLKLNDGTCPAGFTEGNGNVGTVVGSDGSVSLSTQLCFSPETPPGSCPPIINGDPHFVGADGSRFDFSGEPGENFCLVSDAHLHINAYYGGRYGEYNGNPHKALTWIRKVGILWGHHTIMLAAREGASWQYGEGYLGSMEIDGAVVLLSQPGDVISGAEGQIQICWVAAKERSGDDLIDVYEVVIGDIMILKLKVRPEVEHMRTADDGVVHFDLEWTNARISDHAHGVLGQTYRSDFDGRLAQQQTQFSELLNAQVITSDNGDGFLDGVMADYKTTGLLKADCKFSRFARASKRDLETSHAKEIQAGQAISTFSSRKVNPFRMDVQ